MGRDYQSWVNIRQGAGHRQGPTQAAHVTRLNRTRLWEGSERGLCRPLVLATSFKARMLEVASGARRNTLLLCTVAFNCFNLCIDSALAF